MQIKYVYDGETYYTFRSLRQKLWEKQHILVKNPEEDKVNFWANLGVTYIEEETPKAPEPTYEELAANVRRERDSLIAETDFYMMSDYPYTEASLEEVKNYRKALRDITLQEGFPSNVVWPEKPGVIYKQPQKALYVEQGVKNE